MGTDKSEKPDGLGARVLQYVETDQTGQPTGRSVSLTGVDLVALGYADLINQKLGHKVVVPLNWKNARVVESTIPGVDVATLASGNATLQSTFTSRTIGLVKDGWLPSGLALQSGMIVMPDRCTISELESRFQNGSKKNDDDKDFLDLFADHRVQINPLLFALEGNLKANPTPEVVEQQFEEACAKIAAALPLAEIVPGKGALPGIVGLINDTRDGMGRKQEFLLRLAPKLRAPVGATRLTQLWNEVLTVANECGVPKHSLVVVASLSAIAVPNGKSPAKRLLKLTEPSYSSEQAYNALADLRSLEVLMHLFALFPHERLMLCTGDRDLALFWAGVRPADWRITEGHLHFRLSPVDALFSAAPESLMSSYFDPEKSGS